MGKSFYRKLRRAGAALFFAFVGVVFEGHKSLFAGIVPATEIQTVPCRGTQSVLKIEETNCPEAVVYRIGWLRGRCKATEPEISGAQNGGIGGWPPIKAIRCRVLHLAPP